MVPRLAGVGVILLILLAGPACQVTDLRLWTPPLPPAGEAEEIEKFKGIAYWHGPERDDYRHRLDLLAPKEKKDVPVIVLVHGGAWMMGDNRCCGLYTSVGEFLAGQGCAVVLPN